MSAIYVLWLRELRRYIDPVPNRRLARAALTLPRGPRIWTRSGVSESRARQLCSVCCAGNHCDDGAVQLDLLRYGSSLGQAVRVSQRNLVAPVPRLHVMLGRTLGAASVAMCQGLLVAIVCFVAGFRVADRRALPLAFLFMALIACLFSALGTAIGSVLQNVQGAQMIMNFLVLPIFFLSGALYPLTNLPGVLSFATRLDPLAYGVDGLRTTLIGVSHFGLAADGSVLIVGILTLLWVGSRLFSRIQV